MVVVVVGDGQETEFTQDGGRTIHPVERDHVRVGRLVPLPVHLKIVGMHDIRDQPEVRFDLISTHLRRHRLERGPVLLSFGAAEQGGKGANVGLETVGLERLVRPPGGGEGVHADGVEDGDVIHDHIGSNAVADDLVEDGEGLATEPGVAGLLEQGGEESLKGRGVKVDLGPDQSSQAVSCVHDTREMCESLHDPVGRPPRHPMMPSAQGRV